MNIEEPSNDSDRESDTMEGSPGELSVINEEIEPISIIRRAIPSIMLSVSQYVNKTLYIPTSIRTMYPDAFRGAELTMALLTGHPGQIRDMTRLRKEVFLELLGWLCGNAI